MSRRCGLATAHGRRDAGECRARISGLRFPCFSPVISLIVNGESRRFDGPLKVEALVCALELTGKRIALERNGTIVPRGRFEDEWLTDGDRIEIVVAVGGG